jgi:hypothetical protein
MSDTKWRKMFAALDRPDLELGQVIVKFIDVRVERRIRTPKAAALHPPRPYVDTTEFGPVLLRDIEWLEFPSIAEYPNPSPDGKGRVPSARVIQDLEKARSILAALARFPIEQTERGFRVVGHVRRAKSNLS